MPLDYNQRINELLKDNPYAAELGYGQEPAAPADPAEEPDFSHLLQPVTAATATPTGPDLDAPDFSHLLAPIEPAATPGYVGPTDQNYLQQGVNTATRRMTAGALNVAGGTMQGLARDPLGPVGWIPGLRGLADVAQPEQPIGWLQGAGQWAKDVAASPELAAPPGWAGGLTDKVAGAVGSTLPFLATAAIPGGAAVSMSSGALLGSYAALDEQVQEAIRQGATPEQIKQASRLASTGGLTEPIPLEIIFNRIPLPGLAKGAVQIAGRLLAKAAAEGGQEAVQTAIQNFSENYVYNPDQDLTEGLAEAFGLGAVVGGGFGAGAELAAGKAAPAPIVPPTPGVTPPAPGVTTPAPGAPLAPGTVPPSVTPPAPSVTTPPVIPTAPTGMPSVPSVIPPPAPIAADEDALPDLLPMPEEEELVVPEPVVAPVAELPIAPEQPLLPPEAPAAATPAAEQVELPFAGQPGAPTGPQVGGRPAAPSAKLPAAPRTPSQVQQATGVPYAEAARIAENEGWQAPSAPEQGDAEGVDVSHLLQPIGTRRTPALPQFAGDRVNLKASDAQRQARNAEIGHYRWQPGINVGIEVPAAGTRRAMALPGARGAWEAQLPPGVAYGRIKGTRTRKPEIKTFIGSTPNDQVFLIDQIDPTTGKFDEPKVMLDFQSQEEARNAYISSYSDGRGAERIGSISQLPVADFRTWLKSTKTTRPFDRKATAASRRLRQAYTAEAKAQQQAVASAEAAPSEDQGIPGGPEAAVQPAEAQASVPVQQEEAAAGVPEGQAAPDLEGWWDSTKPEHRNEILNAAGVMRSPKLSWKRLGKANQDKVRATLAALSPTGQAPTGVAPQQAEAPTDGGYDSQGLRKNEGQIPQGGAVVRQVSGEGREDFQLPESGAPSDRAPQREEEQPAQQEGLTIGRKAQNYVLEQGRQSGTEILLAIDANGDVVSESGGTDASQAALPSSTSAALRDAKNSIVLIHNHPGSTALSPADIGMVAHAGLHSIWEFGHNGTASRASATEALRRRLKRFSPEKRKSQLLKWVNAADESLLKAIQSRFERDLIALHEFNRVSTHLLNTVLHNAGLIDYHSSIDASALITAAKLGDFLDALAVTTAKNANVEPRTTNRYSDRRPLTLRHAGEVGATLGATAGVPEQRRREEPVHPPSPPDHRREEKRQAPVPEVAPAPTPAPAPDLAARWDKLSLEQKEAALKAAKVARSPISRWKDLGEANQQKLRAAEPEPEVLEERRPPRAPDPGATFATPQETRVLTGLMGKLGKEGVNVSQWNRRIADQYEAAQRLNTELMKTGAAIPEVLNPYSAMLAYSGRTSARGFQTEQQFTKPIMKRLNRIQKAIGRSGTTFEDFNKYLIAMHAAERNAYLRSQGSTIADPSGMSDIEAANIVATAHPEFAAIAPEVYKLLRETADLQLKSGLIDQDTYDLITNRYSFYVPLQGWVEAEGDETVATGQGFDVRGREFHAATGRFSMADAPLAYALQGANRAIARAEKNRVLQVLNRLVQRFPNSEFWQRDRAVKEDYWYEHTDPTTGTVTREIRQRWVPPQTLARSKDGLKNTVVVKEKGVPHYITIHNQPMLEAVRSLGAEEMNGLLRTMGTVLRGIGKIYTTYNPIFIIRNFFRDLQTALLTMQEENLKGLGWSVVKRLRKSGGGMHRYLRGKPKPAKEADDPALWHAHEYARAGGMVGWMEQHSIEKQKDRLQRAIDGKNFSNKVGAAFEVIENANAAVENAVRLSLYMELIGRGYSKQRAALAAKEVTTNFNRKGQWGQAINSLYIFFNARVQGAARIGRVLRNPRARKVKIAALGVLPAMGFLTSLVNRIMGGDDDDGLNAWDSVPQYEKEKNFIVMNPWGAGYLKIPMSYGYNAFYVVGQQIEAAMANMVGYGDGVEPQTAAFNVWHAIANATSPVDLVRAGWSGFVPTLAAPFTEMAENLNYQGAPLYPTKYNPKDPDAELYFRGVNPFWKGVARELERFTKYDRRKPAAIDVSPESMEHLFNTYFGGLGNLVGNQIVGNAIKLANGAWTGTAPDIELPRDIPVVREVLGTENNPFTRQNMYYEVWDKIDTLTADIKDKELTSKEAKAEYPLEYALKSEFESAQKRLREQRERRKKIDNNPRLSDVERKRRLDAVEDKMDDIRSGALQDYAEELKKQRSGATLH